MGRMTKGILGGFAGKVGTVIGSQRSGMDIISSLPKKSTKAPTPAQVDQRDKFSLAVGFLQPINPLLRLGFKSPDPRLSSFNVALSYFVQNSLTGVSGSFSIDYPKVLIAKGELSPAWNAIGVSTVANELKITWTNSNVVGMSSNDDETIVLVYHPEKGQKVMSISDATRAANEIVVELPSDYSGTEVQCWIAFVSGNKKYRSTSSYAGAVTIL